LIGTLKIMVETSAATNTIADDQRMMLAVPLTALS
jgi:hypothetical protein